VTATGPRFTVKFWGVRGSAPMPGKAAAVYGGHTSCIEIRCGEERLLFDAGTGIQAFCNSPDSGEGDLDLFLTHTHLDHVCGLPYLATHRPRGSTCRLWAGHLATADAVTRILDTLMGPPLYPLSLKDMPLRFDVRLFRAGETLEHRPGIRIRTAPLRHPDRATGFRVEFAGTSVAFVTDTEHQPGKPDATVLELIRGADVFIYDATFADEKFAPKIGWGHSTWQEGARLANAASVKTYVVFHHDPENDDPAMDAVARALLALRPGSVVARDGLEISI
jgi:phosphoribosyl 1,2-cyclic phosphodiesterase